MINVRNVLGFLTAAVFVAFALPASAANPEKIYSLNVSPLGTSPIALTIKNETPNGNSTINSFTLTPPPGVTITGFGNSKSSASATVTLSGGKVYVNAFTGLQAGTKTPKSLTIYVNATYPAGTCGATYTWTANAFTGNAFGTEEFSLNIGAPPTSPTQTAGCQYKVVMSPATLGAGGSASLTATITNKTVGGPNISTVTLTPPVGVTPKANGLGSSSGSAALAGNVVTVSGASVGSGNAMTVTIPVDTACVASSGNWVPTASGGGAFSLSTTDVSSLGTQVTGACSMAFTQQPSSGTAGTIMTPAPKVVVSGAGGAPVPWINENESVSLRLGNTCSGSSLGTASFALGTGTAEFANVTIPPAGSYTLTACSNLGTAATTFTSTSSSFTAYSGILGCFPDGTYKAGLLDATDPTKAYVSASDEGKFGLIRGQNKDGVGCIEVPYQFILDISSSPQKAKFIVPPVATTLQQVSAEYVVVWKAVKVASGEPNSGWTINRPKLAWKCSSPDGSCTDPSYAPVYIPALSCVEDPYDPAPPTDPFHFGKVLYGDLDFLLPAIPDEPPFNTPPYSTYYPVGTKAKMCVAQQGWTSAGGVQEGPKLIPLVRYWTRVIDQGDGFMTND